MKKIVDDERFLDHENVSSFMLEIINWGYDKNLRRLIGLNVAQLALNGLLAVGLVWKAWK